VGFDLPPETRIGLYPTSAFVLVLKVRLTTLNFTVNDASPIILELKYVLHESHLLKIVWK
jgi:hypothetical protein